MTAQTEVLELLAEQERLHRRMLPLAEAKRAALLANDVEALAPLVRELEVLAAAAIDAERQRLALVAQLTGRAPEVEVSFDELADCYRGAERELLTGLRAALRTALAALKGVNDANAALVRQALSITRQQSRLLTGGLPATYAASGAVAEPATLRTRAAWQA